MQQGIFVPLKNFVEILTELGNQFSAAQNNPEWIKCTSDAYMYNPWFSLEQQAIAFNSWSEALKTEKVETWIKDIKPSTEPKKVGIIMAGNIPMVGLHDLLCVLISGNNAVVKLSSQDETLMKRVIQSLIEIEPLLESRITITERLNGLDGLIATGSNNSARYFEYYFKNVPHIIRKNRNSVAVITGNETEEEKYNLGKDIFTYYGMGCRNVTHLFLPKDYDLVNLIPSFHAFEEVVNHNKYANNYTYHKAILLMNLTPHIDTGYLLMREDAKIYAPVSILNYTYYDNESHLQNMLDDEKNNIQCICGTDTKYIPFGKSQFPELTDYADGVNTFEFLANIN